MADRTVTFTTGGHDPRRERWEHRPVTLLDLATECVVEIVAQSDLSARDAAFQLAELVARRLSVNSRPDGGP